MSESEAADDTATDVTPFEAIVRVEAIQAFLDRARTLVDEAKIHVTTDGLEIRAVDPANVALVETTLDAEAFDAYQGAGITFGVNLTRLDDVLGVADSDALAQLALDVETNKLAIESEGLEFTVACIDPESIRQEPDMDAPEESDGITTEFVIEGRALDRIETAAGVVDGSSNTTSSSGHVYLRFDPDTETFTGFAQGDTDDVTVDYEREDLVALRRAGGADSVYSLDYVSDIVKPLDAATEVTVHLGEEWPAYVEHEFADGRGWTRYMLAPRVVSE